MVWRYDAECYHGCNGPTRKDPSRPKRRGSDALPGQLPPASGRLSCPVNETRSPTPDAAALAMCKRRRRLLPLVYEELRRLGRLPGSRTSGQTLAADGLVHEAYLRLVGKGDAGAWHGAVISLRGGRAMRRILVDNARRNAR